VPFITSPYGLLFDHKGESTFVTDNILVCIEGGLFFARTKDQRQAALI